MNYSAIDRELFAIYRTNRHFQHILEPREFAVFTDHSRSHSSESTRTPHLVKSGIWVIEANSQLDIQHVVGRNNIVADVILRVETVRFPIDNEALAGAQRTGSEAQQLLQDESYPRMELRKIPSVAIEVYRSTSTGRGQPFITPEFQKTGVTYVQDTSGGTLHHQEH